jgi:hypothetical protein
MIELKESVTSQNKAFTENLESINQNLIEDCTELRDKQNELMGFISNLKIKSQDHKGEID